MDENDIRMKLRLVVLETVVQRMFAVQTIKYSDAEFETISRWWTDALMAETFEGIPPEQGDLLSGELSDLMRSLLEGAKEARQRMLAAL